MDLTIPVEYRGNVFVPLTDVDLPEGHRAEIRIVQGRPPLVKSESSDRFWADVERQFRENPGPFASVDEALAFSRGRP